MKHVAMTMILCSLSSAVATSLQAADIWYSGPTNGSWDDPANWSIGTSPAGRVPSSASVDKVSLSNKVVIVTAPATLDAFSSGGTVNINDGGTLTGTGGYTVRYATINVNSGGQFPINAGWTIRTAVNVNAGGTATGGAAIPQAETRTITVNGTWSPRGTTVAQGRVFTVGTGNTAYQGKVVLGTTGTLILDVFASKTNEYFSVVGMTTSSGLTLNAGSIQLRPQGGYEPKGGDTFTLWTLAAGSAAAMIIGDGSNISILGSSCTLDTSEWATSGKVTVVAPPPGGTVIVLK